jgi:hypothetical protein
MKLMGKVRSATINASMILSEVSRAAAALREMLQIERLDGDARCVARLDTDEIAADKHRDLIGKRRLDPEPK